MSLFLKPLLEDQTLGTYEVFVVHVSRETSLNEDLECGSLSQFNMTEEDVIEFIKDFELDDEFETTSQYKRIDISEETGIHKTNDENNVCFIIIGTFKMLNLNLSEIFVVNVVLDVFFQKQKELKY